MPVEYRDVTIAELFESYLLHLVDYQYSESFMSDVHLAFCALRPWHEMSGSSFGPLALKSARQRMLRGKWSLRPNVSAAPWCRVYINLQVSRIKGVFKWGVSEQMVDPSTLFALQTVTGLPMGIGKDYAPITGATWDQVAAVQPFMTPVIWDMIQVQWNTGMRPGELCGMRCEDIDISDEDPEGVWLYIPRSHKTMRRRRRKVIPLGPRSVRILLTRISGRFHGIFRNRRKKPITTREYGSKVKRGFELSERAGANLTHWTAHQLRHGRATEIDSEYGVHGFEAITGDAANMRRIYVDQNLTLARKIARETG